MHWLKTSSHSIKDVDHIFQTVNTTSRNLALVSSGCVGNEIDECVSSSVKLAGSEVKMTCCSSDLCNNGSVSSGRRISIHIQSNFNGLNTFGIRKICSRQGIDGWMTRDFTSFLTVFQSYQDDVRMIVKGCVQWNSVYG